MLAEKKNATVIYCANSKTPETVNWQYIFQMWNNLKRTTDELFTIRPHSWPTF